MEVAKTYQDELDDIKENVRNAYEAFKPNYDRFNEFRKFVFETSLTSDDIQLLGGMGKPQIEFNITEAYISRLMGEFSKQEPSISVSSENEDEVDPITIHVVEQHIRHIMRDSETQNVRWEIMKDLYSGGFSAAKVWTDYANSKSFKQVIRFDRVYDPTLCGFDPLARTASKGDGDFCFEIFPMTLDAFKRDYPDVRTDDVSFSRAFSNFNWSYMNGNLPIIVMCDYYKKKKRSVKIVELSDGSVMTKKEYKAMEEDWMELSPIPVIKNERWTQMETICRYRCIETEVLEYVETDFTYFPLVFFDGNSILLKNKNSNANAKLFTRPYVYHAMGAQKLKNFAGITLANEMENIVQHKFMIAKEALPKEMDFMDALTNIQKPNNIIFNAFFEEDPDKPIPSPIREVARVPTPPEVVQTFASTDSLLQNILGSYDASLGINDNQLSGVAIVEGATQSNAAAMPYIVGFLQGLQRVAEIFVDLIPKYYVTPRTIPVMGIDGKADYVKINQDNGVDIFYDSNALNVKVEAGVSFQIQKSRALNQILSLMQASPLFNQFMNEKGLSVLLDNIEIRGIDQLKMMVEDWEKELEQQKQMAMQQQQAQAQNNPMVVRNNIEMAKLAMQEQEMRQKAQLQQEQFEIDREKIRQEQIKTLSNAIAAKDNSRTQLVKAETEKFSKQIDLALKHQDMHHRHRRDHVHFIDKMMNRNDQARMSQ